MKSFRTTPLLITIAIFALGLCLNLQAGPSENTDEPLETLVAGESDCTIQAKAPNLSNQIPTFLHHDDDGGVLGGGGGGSSNQACEQFDDPVSDCYYEYVPSTSCCAASGGWCLQFCP